MCTLKKKRIFKGKKNEKFKSVNFVEEGKNNFKNVNFHRSNNRVFQFGCKNRKLKYRFH